MDDADGNDYDDDFGGHKKTASGSSSQTQDRSQLLALVVSPRTLISFTTFSLFFFFFLAVAGATVKLQQLCST